MGRSRSTLLPEVATVAWRIAAPSHGSVGQADENLVRKIRQDPVPFPLQKHPPRSQRFKTAAELDRFVQDVHTNTLLAGQSPLVALRAIQTSLHSRVPVRRVNQVWRRLGHL